MADIKATLLDRGAVYGNFHEQAKIIENILYAINQGAKGKCFEADQKAALEMIAHKIARIVNGNADYADSWLDIAGYALLVANRLEADAIKFGKADNAAEVKSYE